jgi:hypothetical protein
MNKKISSQFSCFECSDEYINTKYNRNIPEGYWMSFHHNINPQHVYCKLNNCGNRLIEDKSKMLTNIYERFIFNPFFADNGRSGLVTIIRKKLIRHQSSEKE